MSHHLDTPLAAQTGQLYLDDLYVFPGEGSTVFVMDVNSNVNGLHSEPGFHPEARYEFKVHFDGADFETLTYRISFSEPDPDGQQALATARPDRRGGTRGLRARRPGAGRPDRRDGQRGAEPGSGPGGSPTPSTSTCRCWPSSTGRWPAGPHRTCPGGSRTTRPTASPAPPSTRSCWRSPTPTRSCGPAPDRRVGATKLATDAGGWRQINRAGHPMMWPIFWPDDTDFSDPSNTRHPSEDVNAAAKYIGEQVAAVVAAAGTSDDPQGYGQTVARDLFPDVLPYVVGNARGLRLRRPQRPDAGRQRPRSDAVPGHQHRGALRAQAGRRAGPADQQLPLRRPGLTIAGSATSSAKPRHPGPQGRWHYRRPTQQAWLPSARTASDGSQAEPGSTSPMRKGKTMPYITVGRGNSAPDPQAAALRCGRRPRLRGGVPARGCCPGRLPAAAPPCQFSRARTARLDPGRKLRDGRDVVPGRSHRPSARR